MNHVKTPVLFVLDALVNDIEDLESVLRMLNSDTALGWSIEWGRPFNREEVVEALMRLIRKDLVQVLILAAAKKALEALPLRTLPPGRYDDVYFMLTGKGRLVHKNWEPTV
jgi:hypothetical protein